jgi:hypothetical protein
MAIVRTIEQVQAELEAFLSRVDFPHESEVLQAFVAPPGMEARVSLRYADGHRKIRRTADASYFDPALCEIVISFEPAEQSGTGAKISAGHGSPSDPLADLVRTLDAAEREPRFREFVGLKTFRDHFLPLRGFDWARDPDERRAVLSRAIEHGVVLRNSVPNPREPSYPTTAIRVNRDHPDGKRILAESVAERSIFSPIALRGPELASTVLAERR